MFSLYIAHMVFDGVDIITLHLVYRYHITNDCHNANNSDYKQVTMIQT